MHLLCIAYWFIRFLKCICLCLIVCVLMWRDNFIMYHQLQLVGSSSHSLHSGWSMLIEEPEATTGDLIYKSMWLVLWGIDLTAFPSVTRSFCLYSRWQQVIKLWQGKRIMKVLVPSPFRSIMYLTSFCTFKKTGTSWIGGV